MKLERHGLLWIHARQHTTAAILRPVRPPCNAILFLPCMSLGKTPNVTSIHKTGALLLQATLRHPGTAAAAAATALPVSSSIPTQAGPCHAEGCRRQSAGCSSGARGQQHRLTMLHSSPGSFHIARLLAINGPCAVLSCTAEAVAVSRLVWPPLYHH